MAPGEEIKMAEMIYTTNVDDRILQELEDTYKLLRRIDPCDKLLTYYDVDKRTIEEEIFDFRKKGGYEKFSLRSSLELYCIALARRSIELWGKSENPDYKFPFNEEGFNINLDAADANSRAFREADRSMRALSNWLENIMAGLTPNPRALEEEARRRESGEGRSKTLVFSEDGYI